jgi:PKD repeat protein
LFEKVVVVRFDVNSPFSEPKKAITFDAAKTKFPDEKVKEFRWDFDGDGIVDEISFTPTFTYTFPKAGTYQVLLEAVSEGGLQGEYSQTMFIRGGLALPKADFSIEKKGNELVLKNTSTVDPSFKEEEVKWEWSFSKADVSGAPIWESYEKVSDLTFSEPLFDSPAAWVTKTVTLAPSELAPGVISRELVLGESLAFVRFKPGTTLADLANTPYLGDLRFSASQDIAVKLPEDSPLVASFDTGIAEPLSSSDSLEILIQGVVKDAKLYQLSSSGIPTLLVEGKVENNLTVFQIESFGGHYAVSGRFEQAGKSEKELIGVSPLKEPIKVFDTPGTYEITLTVTDGLGEKSEKKELVTIDKIEEAKSKQPPAATEGAETVPKESEEPGIPIPELIPPEEEEGGISFFFIVLLSFIVLAVGGVTIIVVRTIRRRQTELEAGAAGATPTVPAAPAVLAKKAQPDVVKAEVVEKKQPPPPSPPPAPAAPPPPLPKAPVAPAKAPSEVKPQKPPDTQGPIPDWLKG